MSATTSVPARLMVMKSTTRYVSTTRIISHETTLTLRQLDRVISKRKSSRSSGGTFGSLKNFGKMSLIRPTGNSRTEPSTS